MKSKDNFVESLNSLDHAIIKFESKIVEDCFYFGGIAKAFETAIEYAWKYFRAEAIEAGLDVPSPRDAIKQAANLGLIENLDEWLGFLKTRNLAVHDYIGIPKEDYLKQIKKFLTLAKKVKV